MLVYEKKVQEEDKLVRHLFGTMGNIPSEDDVQLTYKEKDGDVIEPVLNDTYLDDKHHGIIRKSDGKSVYVFIEDTNIIPGGEFIPVPTDVESIEVTNRPTKSEYVDGQPLDLSGMVVKATYSDGDVKEIVDFTTEPAEGVAVRVDIHSVVVSYQGKTAEFAITVVEKEAESVEELVEAIADGGAVKLNASVELSEPLMVSKDTTIDLNGQTLSTTSTSSRVINIADGSSLVINGAPKNVGRKLKAGKLGAGNSAKIVGISKSQPVIFVGGGAKLEINNCEITSPEYREAIMTNGNDSDVEIKLTNCTINGRSYLPAEGKYEFIDCTVKGRCAAISSKAGELILDGGHFESTATDGDWAHYGNGSLWTGDAIMVESCNYPGGVPKLVVKNNPEIIPGVPAEGAEYKNYDILAIRWRAKEEDVLPEIVVDSCKPYRYAEVTGHIFNGKSTPSDGWYHFTDENTEERQ